MTNKKQILGPDEKVQEEKTEDLSRKRDKRADYQSRFIRKSTIVARTQQTVCVRREYHQTLALIIQVIAENKISMADYLDHVLADHLERYGGEIERLYAEKIKGFSVPRKPK